MIWQIDRITGSFSDKAAEQDFRNFNIKSEKFQAKWFIIIVTILYAFFIIIDYESLGSLLQFAKASAIRLAIILVSVTVLYTIRKSEEYFKLEKWLLAWVVFLVLSVFMVDLLRPVGYLPVIMWEIILILTVFTIMPIRIEFQLTATLLLSYLSLVRWYYSGNVSIFDPQTLSYVLGYLVSNLFGYLISWQINRIRRTQYRQYAEELSLRKELETALNEVKELQGLIPICANCKSVREDTGYWSSVENYISHHSKLSFSHSVCPTCAKKLYPDIEYTEDLPDLGNPDDHTH